MALSVLGVLAALGACGTERKDATAPVSPVAEVIVVPAQLTLRAGAEAALQAQANDVHGMPVGGAELRYESQSPGVLQVAPNGEVLSTGRLADAAWIVVHSGAAQARVRVRVEAGEPQRLEAVAPLNGPMRAGVSAPAQGSVRALDAYGNPVPGVELELSDAQARPLTANFRAGAVGTGTAQIPAFQLAEAGTHLLQVRVVPRGAPVLGLEVQVQAVEPVPAAVTHGRRRP